MRRAGGPAPRWGRRLQGRPHAGAPKVSRRIPSIRPRPAKPDHQAWSHGFGPLDATRIPSYRAGHPVQLLQRPLLAGPVVEPRPCSIRPGSTCATEVGRSPRAASSSPGDRPLRAVTPGCLQDLAGQVIRAQQQAQAGPAPVSSPCRSFTAPRTIAAIDTSGSGSTLTSATNRAPSARSCAGCSRTRPRRAACAC